METTTEKKRTIEYPAFLRIQVDVFEEDGELFFKCKGASVGILKEEMPLVVLEVHKALHDFKKSFNH